MAVTENKTITRREGCRDSYPIEEAVRLYQGTLSFVNAAGYAVPTTGSGANRFGGVVIADQDNSSGADGALDVEVFKDGEFLLTGTGFTQASVGKPAFASDNYTVNAGRIANGVYVGEITEYVSTTKVWVRIVTDQRDTAGVVETKTADFTMTAADSGKSYETTGAAGTVVGSLPAALPGMEFWFRVGAAQELRLDPSGTETISLPSTGVAGAAGKYLTANAAGETVHLKCLVAGTWSAFGFTGTWTAEA